VKGSRALVAAYLFAQMARHLPPSEWPRFRDLLVCWQVKPNTQVSYRRLFNVYQVGRQAERERIAGAFVECGVWKGGCAAVLASVAERGRSGRQVWLFDSFEGMPEASERDGPDVKELSNDRYGGKLVAVGTNVASVGDVEALLFDRLGLDRGNVHIRRGWFQDTVPTTKDEIGPIALLRLDGDYYDSTKSCLDHLYDSVTPGGYVIVDDYGYFPSCGRAVDEFLEERGIQVELLPIDDQGLRQGAYFRKPAGAARSEPIQSYRSSPA
jgi:hypothetical protein